MAIRGRKPNPAGLKVVTGNPGKRKQAQPKGDGESAAQGPVTTAPTFLSQDAKNEWKRLARALHNLGLLTTADRTTMAAYCQCYGRWAQAERKLAEMAKNDPHHGGMIIRTAKGNAVQNPLVGIANKAASDMVKYASEMGLTPTARARLEIGIGQPGKGQEKGGAARYFPS